jgi:putative ABC transport system substrate-binding protein
LAEGGYVAGRNLTIEFRWARGRYDLLPAMAAELVSRRVAVLTTAGGEPSALAAKRATSTMLPPVRDDVMGNLSFEQQK